MNLQEQVVSLELAKQLKEAGYPQEGLFWWGYFLFTDGSKQLEVIPESRFNENDIEGFSPEKICVAPTCAELFDKFPSSCNIRLDKWVVYRVWHKKDNEYAHFTESKNIADALGKAWLKLKQEGLL